MEKLIKNANGQWELIEKSDNSDEAVGSKIMRQLQDEHPGATAMYRKHLALYNGAHPWLKGKTYLNRTMGQDEFTNDHHNESLGHFARTGKILTHSKKDWDAQKGLIKNANGQWELVKTEETTETELKKQGGLSTIAGSLKNMWGGGGETAAPPPPPPPPPQPAATGSGGGGKSDAMGKLAGGFQSAFGKEEPIAEEIDKGETVNLRTREVIDSQPTDQKSPPSGTMWDAQNPSGGNRFKGKKMAQVKNPVNTTDKVSAEGQLPADKEAKLKAAMKTHGQFRGKDHENYGSDDFDKSESKEVLKTGANGQWSLDKAEMGRGGKPKDISMFTSEHMNKVVGMPHADAKAYAHAAVDGSAAKPENKVKAKAMIEGSKSSKHLAMGMGNFLLASEGLKV